jgi:hypothetical protein
MTILYEGFGGTEPSTVLTICFSILGLFSLISLFVCLKTGDSGSAVISFMGLALSVIVVLVNITSRSYPIVRATIDDTTSFKEIYESYELIDVEGDIYTFKVKDSDE